MAERSQYNPEKGTALDKDNVEFDVTEWRKGMIQPRDGQDQIMTFDSSGVQLLTEILNELKHIKTHLSLITEEELEDVN
jgi:hypothetical protein